VTSYMGKTCKYSRPEKGSSFDHRIVIKYDSEQHEIEHVEENQNWGDTSTTTSVWRNNRLESQPYNAPGRAKTTNSWSRKWRYDASGRVMEFHEHGGLAEPHYFYHYDSEGRMLGWDYKQWGDDLFSRAKIRYAGNSIETDTYDERGRTVEKETDPYSGDVGADNAPLPGKLVVHYDDVNNTISSGYTTQQEICCCMISPTGQGRNSDLIPKFRSKRERGTWFRCRDQRENRSTRSSQRKHHLENRIR
jgi:hypothetical protein